MQSMPSRANRKRKRRLNKRFISLLLLLLVGGVFLGLYLKDSQDEDPKLAGNVEENNEENEQNEDEINTEPEEEEEPEPVVTYSEMKLAVAGDIMAHGPQINSARENGGGAYDFKPMF